MAVAKRQGREKPTETEQRKVRGPERRRQAEETAPLAKPSSHRAGPGGGKHIRGGAKSRSLSLPLLHACALSLSPVRWRAPPLSSLRIFGLACPHASRMDSPAIF